MRKKIVSSVLCLAMLASMGTTAFAAEYSTSADLTVEGLVFNLSVPTSLPISVDNAGGVTVATDSVITNNSGGMVYVSNVKLTPENDWEIVEYNTDFTKEKVNLSQFGITLNSDEVDIDGTLTLGSEWVALSANGGKLPIIYEVNVASQSSTISETISTVEFTLDWDSEGSSGQTYDLIIASQEDFDTMVASDDWLGATSVLFDGSNGAFTSSKLYVPDTVTTIVGRNDAAINAIIEYVTSKNGNSAYSISNITSYRFTNVSNLNNCTSYVFMDCTNLTYCTAKNGEPGFYKCTNLISCTATNCSIAFDNCTYLTDCKVTGPICDYGFWSCTTLTDCTVYIDCATADYYNCKDMTNCIDPDGLVVEG